MQVNLGIVVAASYFTLDVNVAVLVLLVFCHQDPTVLDPPRARTLDNSYRNNFTFVYSGTLED